MDFDMKKIRPWLVLGLVFVAGFAGGIVTTRAMLRHTIHQALRNPDYLPMRVERRLAFALRLDARQRVKLHEILQRTQADLRALRGEFQPRFLGLVNRAQSELAAELSPEQQKRLEKFQQENRAWWPGR
jgi:hypothetical protein